MPAQCLKLKQIQWMHGMPNCILKPSSNAKITQPGTDWQKLIIQLMVHLITQPWYPPPTPCHHSEISNKGCCPLPVSLPMQSSHKSQRQYPRPTWTVQVHHQTLRQQYNIQNWIGNRYIGLTQDWDYGKREIHLPMSNLLQGIEKNLGLICPATNSTYGATK